MTKPTHIDNLSLFAAMDLAADMMRATQPCEYCDADDQVIFRKLQKPRLPDLTPEQFQTLYAEWQEHYHGKCIQDRIKARDRLIAYAEEQAKKNPPSPPFRCACGAVLDNPGDPKVMAVHAPHVQAAADERRRRMRDG
jgi:hypothetical protein